MNPKRCLGRAPAALALVFLPACSLLPSIDFERMIDQDRFTVWQHCVYFPDGRELQTPPAGTLPRGEPTGDPGLTHGVAGGAYLTQIPLRVTRDLVLAGKARFETYCAACHGLRGDGVSVVAFNMDLRKPPAIAGRGARTLLPGRVYQVIDEGYGLMRSYTEDLISPEERWSVVAYLGALQRSHEASLDALPPALRREAEKELR